LHIFIEVNMKYPGFFATDELHPPTPRLIRKLPTVRKIPFYSRINLHCETSDNCLESRKQNA
jgi:hypothetical protein